MRVQELLLAEDSLLECADSVANVGCLRGWSLVVVVMCFGNRVCFTEFELVWHVCSSYHLHRFLFRCPCKEVRWTTHFASLGLFHVLFHVLRLFLVGFDVGIDRDYWSTEDRLGCSKGHRYRNLGILR